MRSRSIEHRGHTRRGTPLVMLLASIGAVAGCASSHATEPPPATAATQPEPNSVVEQGRLMAFSRESPAPTPDKSAAPHSTSAAAKVRRALMDADGLSSAARNVMILTTDGQVTLRGPVKTAAEKSRVEELARKAAGSARVVNQLEIKE